jgi:hypothetical protein
LNCPSARISPIITGLCRWWLVLSIVSSKPHGALNFWPPIAAMTLSTSVVLAFSTACFHMCMPDVGGFHRVVGDDLVGVGQLLLLARTRGTS